MSVQSEAISLMLPDGSAFERPRLCDQLKAIVEDPLESTGFLGCVSRIAGKFISENWYATLRSMTTQEAY
jgi:hypothetical protein